ncbi:MAG: sulfatase-like hydrolase/transferase [Acidobacteriota bacterium]|nr:sulfatase-like hydrolase/transferase [Acidobacteriota bacterium]
MWARRLAWTVSLGLALVAVEVGAQPDPPNLVFIMLDDMGWSDVGVYGGSNPTPEMDALAAEGVQFLSYYTMGTRCSPTRASFLTGLDPAAFGMDVGVPKDSPRGVPGGVRTLPEALGEPGVDYATWHVGKWHLGIREPHHRPCGKGFQRSVRLLREDYIDPDVDIDCSGIAVPSEGHATQVLTDRAMELIGEHVSSGDSRRFFLNLWYWAPHTPLEPPQTAPMPGMDPQYLPEHCPERIEDPQSDADERQNFDSLLCFADFQIGRLVDFLEELGLMQETLVVVTSDNGGTHQPWHGPNGPYRGFKTETFEGGIRAPLIMRWDGALDPGEVNDALIYSFDWFPTFLELAGGDPSGEAVEGRSFAVLFDDSTYSPPPRARFWESKFSKQEFQSTTHVLNWGALRRGQWKLVVEPVEDGPHREHLFDIVADPFETTDRSGDFPNRTAAMMEDYLEWRGEVSRVPLAPYTEGGAGITTGPGGELEYEFSALDPGLVHLTHDDGKNFHAAHFTFVVDILPEATNVKQLIASSAGAWKLVLRETGIVALNITGENDGPNTILEATVPLTAGEWHRVAFTVRYWRGPLSTARLFIDDRPIIEAPLLAPPETSERPVSLGARFNLDHPFGGRMTRAALHMLDLYPQQIR